MYYTNKFHPVSFVGVFLWCLIEIRNEVFVYLDEGFVVGRGVDSDPIWSWTWSRAHSPGCGGAGLDRSSSSRHYSAVAPPRASWRPLTASHAPGWSRTTAYIN